MSSFFLPQQLLLPHAVEHLHAEVAGKVIVADPRVAQRRVFRTGTDPQMAGTRGEAFEAFEHRGDVRVCKSIIAVAALFFLCDQAAGFELC